MPEIFIDSLSKCFEGGGKARWALNKVSLHIFNGEFLAIIGPSGAGKTTLLRMVAGLEAPTSGRILFDGVDMTGSAPHLREVAMVFQHGALFPHMTVQENLGIGLKLRHVARNEIAARVTEAAAMLGLSETLAVFPNELSGGQRQRVALGRALVRKPKVLLLDEPLSSLDPHLRGRMRSEIARIHTALNATVIYVTHEQTEAAKLARRVALLNDGALLQVGEMKDLVANPATSFVAEFLNSA